MATIAAVPTESDTLSPGHALRLAWLCWLILLAIPALFFCCTMWAIMSHEDAPGNGTLARAWFLGCMIYLAVAVPAAFFWRGHIFKNYWNGLVVSPRHYLKGMLIVWLALEIGGIAALVGCLVTNTVTPNILPALVAFMLFTPFWPTGRSMTNPVGNDEDFGIYEEPR